MEPPMNFVFIVSDTLRRDHVSCYGNSEIHTPHLAKLAEQAAVFDWHLIGSFPTMPARADMLTGRLSCTFMGWEPLPQGLVNVPQLLSAAGYNTMGVVDTPFFVRDGFGYDRGFDDFIWIRGQGDFARPEEEADVKATWRDESDRFVARTMSAAEGWLDRHHREPFFLYVDTWDPHEPWDAPEYYTERYLPGYDGRMVYPPYAKLVEGSFGAASEEDARVALATYKGEVTMVDRWVGRLLEKIELLGIADRTAIFFTSDHGLYFGEHDFFGKAVYEGNQTDDEAVAAQPTLTAPTDLPEWLGSGTELTQAGLEFVSLERSPLYQELVRVPFLAKVPGIDPCRPQSLTTAIDIPATILDLAGLERPDDVDGRSVMPVLRGETDEHRDFVVSSWPLYLLEGEYTSAIDSRPRKAVTCMPLTVTTRDCSVVVGGAGDVPEMFDLVADPDETRNVWADQRDRGAGLITSALDYLSELGAADKVIDPRRDYAEDD